MSLRDLFKRKKKKEGYLQPSGQQAKKFAMAYSEPAAPGPEEAFIQSIGSFCCVQYWRRNDMTGGTQMRELIAAEMPRERDLVLSFLAANPIRPLLNGDLCAKGHDMDRWELRFLFEDPTLNRRICGYGVTELTAPFVLELARLIPEVLTEEERWEREFQKRRFLAETEGTAERRAGEETGSF